jgi:hypothetical protein
LYGARYREEFAIVEIETCNVTSTLGAASIEYIDDVSARCYADGHCALRTSLVTKRQPFVIDAEDGNIVAARIYHDQPSTVFAEE